MSRPSGGRGSANWSQVPREGREVVNQPLPLWLEPKGVDRFHESSRVDHDHATKIRNLMFDDAILVSRRGTNLMGGNAASTVMQIADFIRQGTKKVTLRFCTRHIEIFEYASGNWRSFPLPLSGGEKDFFCWTGWADKLLFSNGIDGLWEFDFKAYEAKLVPGGPSAKSLTTFGNRVMASAVTVEGGDYYPLRIMWTAKNDYKRWAEPTVAKPLTSDLAGGHEDFYGSPGGITDEVMGVFPFSDESAWVVRSRSIWQLSVSGNVLAPFRASRIIASIGSPYRNSIVQTPAGLVFLSRDNIHLLNGTNFELIGQAVIDELDEELTTFKTTYAAYNVGRDEYLLAGEQLVFRYRFQEKGWTTDQYVFSVKSLSRQIQGNVGIPIDSLPRLIPTIPPMIDSLIGRIDDLVQQREDDDSMMFVPESTQLTIREFEGTTDVDMGNNLVESEFLIETGVVSADALSAIELLGINLEYISEKEQLLEFNVSFDDCKSFQPLSLKTVEETQGSEIVYVKAERVSRKLQIQLRSDKLGKLRILGMAPEIIKVNRVMAPKKPKVASIEVLPSPLALQVGNTQQLSVTLRGPGGQVVTGYNITYISSNRAIATVSGNGTVRAIDAGSFAIIVSVGNVQVSVAGSVTALTQAAVGTVSVTPSISQGATGTTQQFTATIRDANGNILLGRTVTWGSSNNAVATAVNGVVQLLTVGTVAISATSEGVTGAATLSITASAAVVASVEIVPASFSGTVGDNFQLEARPKDASLNVLSGKTIAWSSSSPSVATVSATGLVTAVGAGTVTISATCETITGTSAGNLISAVVPVSTITVTPSPFSIAPGGVQALTVVLKDASGNVLVGRTVTYLSSNTAVALVDGTGVVLGVAPGTATITVASEGKSTTTSATITQPAVNTVSVSPGSFSLGVGATQQLVATAYDSLGNALTGRTVSWGSNDITKATVSSSGVVTGVSAGGAIITATIETKVGTSVATVGVGTYSALNAPASVVYAPEPNPSGMVAELPRTFVTTNLSAMSLSYAQTVTLTEQGSRAQNSTKLQQLIDEAAARAGHTRINVANGVAADSPITRFHTAGPYYTDIMWPNLPVLNLDERVDPTDMVDAPTLWAMTGASQSVSFDRKANNTRFNGIKFKAITGITVYDLIGVTPREGSVDYDTDINNIPVSIHFNQCLVEGNDSGNGINSGNVRNGVTLNARASSLTNSYVHQVGSTGTESHAFIAYNTPGPLKIVNNFLEATSICAMIGGDQPHYGVTVGRPSDIEFRRNDMTRRLSWAINDPAWDGVTGRGIKNQFETKNALRILVEGNTIHRSWADGQTGSMIVIKSAQGSSSNSAFGQGSESVTLRFNKLFDGVRAWVLAALPDEPDAIPATKVSVFDNLTYNIGTYAGQTSALALLFLQNLDDLGFKHNTVICNAAPHTFQLAYPNVGNPAKRFVCSDNIFHFAYVWGDLGVGSTAINQWSDGTRVWERNVCIIPDSGNWSIHPQGTNQFVTSPAGVGFTNLAADDYTLAPTSPFKGDGEGGTDPGANMTKVNLATSGVLAGTGSLCSIVTTTTPKTTSSFVKPAYLSPVTEPDFGTKITRITGDVGVAVPTVGGNWPNKIYHNYSKDQPWSSDQALIAIKQTSGAFGSNALFLDGTTYAPAFTRAGPSGGGEWRWHPTLPGVAISIAPDGSCRHWTVVANTTLVKVAAVAGYTSNEMGPSEGNPTYDGSKIVAKAVRTSDSHIVARVLNINLGTAGVVIDLTAAGLGTLDWVSISALGAYVVAYGDFGGAQRTRVWDSTTGALIQTWNDYTFGHYDLGVDQAGNEVAFGVVGQAPYSHHPIMRRLSNGAITDLGDAWTSFNWHASTRNSARPGWGTICVNDDTGYPFDLEVFNVRLGGSGQQVERVGRHRTNNVDYDSAAFACPSPNGKRVMFASCWGDPSGRPVQAYVIDVRDICP